MVRRPSRSRETRREEDARSLPSRKSVATRTSSIIREKPNREPCRAIGSRFDLYGASTEREWCGQGERWLISLATEGLDYVALYDGDDDDDDE